MDEFSSRRQSYDDRQDYIFSSGGSGYGQVLIKETKRQSSDGRRKKAKKLRRRKKGGGFNGVFVRWVFVIFMVCFHTAA